MSSLLAPETLSRLIGAIYDSALDPENWLSTLGDLRHALGFHNASINIQTVPVGTILLNITTGIAPNEAARMPAYGADVVAAWGGPENIAAQPLDEPAVLSRVSDPANWRSNRYYVEWAEPQGLVDVMALGLSRDAALLATIGLGRHRDAGPIGDAEVAAGRLLVPHLQRAVAISRILELKTVAAATFASTLDGLSAAVVLVGQNLEMVHANAAGQGMLAAGDPIRAERGRLAARAAAVSDALARAVRQAVDDEAAIGRRGFGIPAPRADGSPCVLHVLPMRRGALRSGLALGAAAALFVAPASAPPVAPKEALAALFDLTAAESRVFAQAAQGLAVAQIAQGLGIGRSTVKTHLLQVYAKTGARRQIDLVRLAASLALPA